MKFYHSTSFLRSPLITLPLKVFSLSVGLSATSALQAGSFPGEFELSSLTNAVSKAGTLFNGIAEGDTTGSSIKNAGDINKDGLQDFIVGAPQADINGVNAGGAYVVFGKKGGLTNVVNLNDLNGINGFKLNGVEAGDNAGFSVSGAGDVNGDGFDDVIIGAYKADANNLYNAGQAYVVFGKSGGFGASLNLASLNGANGFKINGEALGDLVGGSVSGAGDVNGDGIDDVIIGAIGGDPSPNRDGAGQIYVVFGKKGAFAASLNLATLNGANGFQLNGIGLDHRAGRAVSGAGDVNGDGIDDVLIGADLVDLNNQFDVGQAYIVYGKKAVFPATLELNGLNGALGIKINGVGANDRCGRSLGKAGDVNGDGVDDIIIGAQDAEESGQAYVVFGKKGGLGATLELDSLNGSNGFILEGDVSGDGTGHSVSGAGDVNGDKIDDLIVGAHTADPNFKDGAGRVYLIFGKKGPFEKVILASELDGGAGFKLNGLAGTKAGSSVDGLGDFNGDGIGDFLIGANEADLENKANAGQCYVIYGRNATSGTTLQGDFTANGIPDLIIKGPKKVLSIIPLTIDSQGTVKAEAVDFNLPLAVTSEGGRLPKKSKLLSSINIDNLGVSDFLVKEGKKGPLKLFRLSNNGKPISPTILGEVDFQLPRKHRYVAVGDFVGQDGRPDLVMKKGRKLFVAANVGGSNIFSSELQPFTGKVKGKILSVQPGRILTAKGKQIQQQLISTNGVIGDKEKLGTLAKKQKAVLVLDLDQDGKVDVVTLGKKRSLGYVSELNLSAEPKVLFELPKKVKVIGPQ